MIVPGILVCSSFLISVCMFIVSKALLISSITVIVCAGGAIWLNPFAAVLFTVCSAVTVECCVLYPCCEECESKRPMCFRCLMFRLSGPCESSFLLCFIAPWT